jgi:hypothetical protein
MAKYARGSKSKAISDISGFEVPYPKLKTTYDNLRVEPEEFDPKHPQLTPAKNVIDATALFNPRPDNDPENITILLGFTQNIFSSKIDKSKNSVGIPGHSRIGGFIIDLQQSSTPSPAGTNGTGNLGTSEFEVQFDETGVAGTGAIGSESIEFGATITETGVAGTGAVGTTSSSPTTYTVTFVSTDSGNKYVIDGTQQPTLSLTRGNTYVFDWSGATSHPVRFSTTSDGTHGVGSEYTTGVTKDDGAYKTTIVVSGDAPDNLYYYCQVHSAMGGAINVSFTPSVGLEASITEVGVAGTGAVEPFGVSGNGNVQINVTGTSGVAGTGVAGAEIPSSQVVATGVAGTGATGTEIVESDAVFDETGVAGTGAIGTEIPFASIDETGVAGTGAIGTEIPEASITETGVAGTGATGTESIEADVTITETGVAGTGAIGNYNTFSGTDVGVTGLAGTGAIGTEIPFASITETGVAGTGAIGTEIPFASITETGVAGDGAIGSESIIVDCTITETGVAGTGAIGTEVPQASITETGVAGTGATGTESLELNVTETGVAGTGAVEGFGVSGDGNVQINVTGTSGVAGTGDVGNEVSSSQVIETGVAGTGATGTESVTVNQEWGSGTWGDGTWGN